MGGGGSPSGELWGVLCVLGVCSLVPEGLGMRPWDMGMRPLGSGNETLGGWE